jgi:hypothetical protein
VGTNVDATSETSEPNVTGGDTTSVWYAWTAAAYTGSAVDSLNSVADAANDDFYGFASQITFDASNGMTYDIRVAGYGGVVGRRR